MERGNIESDIYIAHYREESSEIQSVSEHNRETARLARMRCTIESLAPIAYLSGELHDCGKYSDRFQEYIRQGEEAGIRRGEVNHATAGGILIEETAPLSLLSEMVQIAVYSHHGIQDTVDLETGKILIEKRQSREYLEREKIEIDCVKQRFYQDIGKDILHADCSAAREAAKVLIQEIKQFAAQNPAEIYGSRNFYLGMYERMLLSLLIDADRSNTAQFMNGFAKQNSSINTNTDTNTDNDTDNNTEQIWQQCIDYFENYRKKFSANTKIDVFRKEISDMCFRAAFLDHRLYRLTLPTGSGKTLSGLRFALHHAKQFKKRRIIYVAPFTSILEQNAEEIRQAIGNPDFVLEHHCSVFSETAEEQKTYERLTENWSSPIVATTAVQFLNTLFSSRTGSIRRMHSLCSSIVIFDEIQSLPVHTVSLFNLAVNYLTAFCSTTVVLCSATQPVFDKLPKNRLLPPKEIVEDYIHYDKMFRRVTLTDQTRIKPGGLTVEELGDFISQHLPIEKQILVIVNTKMCAKHLYHYLKKTLGSTCDLFHLSTNMCVLNRREVLKQIEECLERKDRLKPMVCISTQLIEAGVDLSFHCVIRSLAGLDNIIQAAGRCNRHGERQNGSVYVVKMSEQAENLSHLEDIRIAQNAMEEILQSCIENPQIIGGDLLSAKAKEQYYYRYLRDQAKRVDFCVKVCNEDTNLVELLSDNKLAKQQYKRYTGKDLKKQCTMKQAFRTAGDLFEVISEEGKINVVVEYDSDIASMVEELQDPYTFYGRQKEILRRLQLASVGISEQMKNELGRAVTPICGGMVNVLDMSYYSKETGVSMEPIGMKLLSF